MFDNWFAGKPTGRPLIKIHAKREKPLHDLLLEEPCSPSDLYCNMQKKMARTKNYYALYEPIGEAFPHTSVDLGAGTLALYVGSEPIFTKETVWFKECMENYSSLPFKFD